MRLYELTKISELRRNPDQNPRAVINQKIIDRYERDPNSFVSFTIVDKLGINPGSKWGETPIGIYAYPTKYVVDKIGKTGRMIDLPTAGNYPWVSIFSPRGNVINLADINREQTVDLITKLCDLVSQGGKFTPESAREYLDKKLGNIDRFARYAVPWWSAVHLAAYMMVGEAGGPERYRWNWLFRKLGIDVVIDPGFSIIHQREPYQAVFFSMAGIKDVERYRNAYNPKDMDIRKFHGELKDRNIKDSSAKLKTATDPDEIVELLDKYGRGRFSIMKKITDPKMISSILYRRPEWIAAVKNPTAEEQWKAASGLIHRNKNQQWEIMPVIDGIGASLDMGVARYLANNCRTYDQRYYDFNTVAAIVDRVARFIGHDAAVEFFLGFGFPDYAVAKLDQFPAARAAWESAVEIGRASNATK